MDYKITSTGGTLPNGKSTINIRVLRVSDDVEVGKAFAPDTRFPEMTAGRLLDEMATDPHLHPSFIPNENFKQ